MPGYIVLGKFTKKGLDRAKEMPEIVETHKKLMMEERGGVRLVGTWFTLGEYDAVSIYEAPDDETMAAATLAALQSGLVTTQTLRAFSEEEFASIVAKLP